MTTEEMVKEMTDSCNSGSFSVYGTYQRQDDEHGCHEVEYDCVEVQGSGYIIVFYDVVITDHKQHATFREHERDYFENLPIEEQVALYEIVMEKIEDLYR